ncbi:dephospho-CoA kinase [Pseudoalteromonas phenolica]|uniref:Dephospho-CoA kinase n=1 Tax=Pseudoalteromonas phenolica TaxID=161398 RepID=A0A5R9Q3Y8_9GAMM|nr:dephospho-CoA kinase [Pseudoalteromonas phenolica]TLX47880.1 dephospho-CoA kinase [Pseudoalteromonas phenolica]
MSNWILGLTGGIGAGKTLVSNHLASLGIEIVDADVIARDVVAIGSDGLNAIKQHFGSAILLDDGSLNRAKLRDIIFADSEQKNWLNNLLHPLIRQNITEQLNNAKSPYVVLSAPLLYENKLDALCNHTLLVDVPVEVQLTRTANRDSVSTEQVKNIIAAQMSREDKRQKADSILDNHRDIDSVLADVEALHHAFLQHAEISK